MRQNFIAFRSYISAFPPSFKLLVALQIDEIFSRIANFADFWSFFAVFRMFFADEMQLEKKALNFKKVTQKLDLALENLHARDTAFEKQRCN